MADHAGGRVQHHAAAAASEQVVVDGSDTDWWLWIMFSFFIFACIIVFLIIIFEDPEVRSASRQHARRLSDWYNERSRQQQQDEMMRLASQHAENSPPLYQTIVPPTYQYQKPPTPREPPPKYEPPDGARSSDQGPAPPPADITPDPIEDIVTARERADNSPTAEDDASNVGQPQYVKKGKVKKSRVSPLLQQIRALEGHKILSSGHNIFVRKSNTTTSSEGGTGDAVQSDEEELVYEMRTETVNPFEVQ